MYDALEPRDLALDELAQRRETGHDVRDVDEILARRPPETDRDWLRLLDTIEATTPAPDWAYVEPDELAEIVEELDPAGDEAAAPPDRLAERIAEAWVGRVAGCMLGKPIERGDHWTARRIRTYLEMVGAYPLTDYIPVLDPMPRGYEFNPSWVGTTRGRVDGAVRDDDIDYTVLNLMLLEQHGPHLTSEDVGQEWLRRLPCLQTYTAERAAYRNLVVGRRPPETATWRNPYREWIGAAIRADAFGYVHPGRPRAAALLAYRDARLSHVGNGVYAEMWLAALVAVALDCGDPAHALRESLHHVPRRSRLAEALRVVVGHYDSGASHESALAVIQQAYGGYAWVHAVSNACLVAAALLWGGGDWTRSVALVVQAGWDTDSNGATVGSVMGAALGAGAVPTTMRAPLRDLARPGLFGCGPTRISELAARTVALVEAFAADGAARC